MYKIETILPDVKKKDPLLHLPKMSVGCFFRVEKYKKHGVITYAGPWFKNTVLNVGLDQIATGQSLAPGVGALRWINVGTGTSEPAATQTGLDTYLASTNTTYGGMTYDYSNGDELAGNPAWRSFQRTLEFAIGSCTGNLTELGLSRTSNANYFNRQLFRDDLGDPTVITVLSDEGIRITVKLVVYAPMAVGETASADFSINGSTKTATITQLGGDWLTEERSYIILCYMDRSGWTSIATETGSFINFDSVSLSGYSSGSFYRDAEYTWSPGTFVGEWKKIGRMVRLYLASPDIFEIELSTAETITDTDELKITLRQSWGRV